MEFKLTKFERPKLNDPLILTRVIAGDMEKTVQMRFRTERDPKGESWEPLKHRKGKILQDTGILKGNIPSYYDKVKAVVGTNFKEYSSHQYGDKKRNIPKRSFLGFSKSQEKKYYTWIRQGLISKEKTTKNY